MSYYKKLDVTAENSAYKTGKANRKLLAFVICFLISALLWTIIALNKHYKSTITFTIRTSADKKIKVTASVYGEGFDLLKEKLFEHRPDIVLENYKSNIETEKYLRDKVELNEDLKYSDFNPETIQ